MQEQNNAGTARDKREMIALLNGGDKRELRAFMQLYSKQIYGRAFDITHDAVQAKQATRRVLAEVAALAARGGLKENIDAQLMALTDQVCSEALFFNGLVDEAMKPDANKAMQEEAPAAPEPAAAAAPTALPGPKAWVYAANAPAEEAVLAPESENEQAAHTAGEKAFAPKETIASESETEEEDLEAEVPNLFDDDADDVDDAATPMRERSNPIKRRETNREDDEEGAGPLLVIAIILLSLVVVFLVWILVVKLMTSGVLPNYDFGFARWFNAHVFELY